MPRQDSNPSAQSYTAWETPTISISVLKLTCHGFVVRLKSVVGEGTNGV